MNIKTMRLAPAFWVALSSIAIAAPGEAQLGLKEMEIGASISALKNYAGLKCNPPERVHPSDIETIQRTRCSLSKPLMVGEQKSSRIDLVLFGERLHQIRADIAWQPPPTGDERSRKDKFDESVRVLRDALTLKYPSAVRKEWERNNTRFLIRNRDHRGLLSQGTPSAYTWHMPAGQIKLDFHSEILELTIDSAEFQQLSQAFAVAQTREVEARRIEAQRAATDEAQRRVKKAAGNL